MARPFDTYDGISAAEAGLYSIFLIGAIYLCIKHGFSKSAGWRALLILSLVRIIGGGMRLATISMKQDLHNTTLVNLYIGWAVCNSLGLGPLILMLLGLLSRAFESMNRNGHMIIKPMYHRLIQILMLVGMILLIVGGSQAKYSLDGSQKIEYTEISRVGLGVMIAVVILLCLETIIAFMNQGYVAEGEHRLILVIVASLPFVVVRVAYSCLLVFGNSKRSPWLSLGMSVLMEVIVVTMCQILGFTLDKAPEEPKPIDLEMQSMQQPPQMGYPHEPPQPAYQQEPMRYSRRQRRHDRQMARRY